MGKTFRFAAITFLALSGGWALAQGNLPNNSGDVVQVQGYPGVKPLHPGDLFAVAFRVRIQEGWHVNGHSGLPEGFIPMELTLPAGTPASLASAPDYPQGTPKNLAGAGQAFPVYEAAATLYAQVQLSSQAPLGPLALPFQLRVQACNDQVCLSPATVPVTVEAEVAKIGQPVVPVHPEIFQGAPAAASGNEAPENIIAKYLRVHGLLLTFVLIFLGGLALNLTPCVYPMIPLTISYFGNQKAEKASVILVRAVAYVVGISITYSSLGVTAALTGRILGSTLQSPWVLSGISAVLVTLSLSMFGLYEIQAPAWLLNRIATTNTQGWLGALGMGLVFGIVAAPCVDPFSIGLLTFVATKADPFLGFIMFFTLSLGLGFPYVWLGFFSGEIQKLPKSGMWMVWVKKIFGLVLLGMPLYFLNPMLPKGFSPIAVPAYLLVCGVLLGWVFSGKGVTPMFKRFQNGLGVFLVAMAFLVFRAWPQPVELAFQAYTPSLLEEAQKEGKPVFIDFSASWCLPCKEMEVNTFPQPEVREAMKGWVLLRADLTQYSSPPVEALKKAYGIMGVPTLIFLGPDGKERAPLRAVGLVTPAELVKKLAEGKS